MNLKLIHMTHKLFKKSLLIVILTVFIFTSCKKEPGEGGTATVTGKVWVERYNSTFAQLLLEHPGEDEDVYIVYGNNEGYDDRTRADYNGVYRFNFLRQGKYKIYVYSKDSTKQSPSGKTAVIREFEITKNKEVIEIPKITIFK